MQKAQRLDHILVERGFYETRSRARDAVMRGAITIDGVVSTKAGAKVSAASEIMVQDHAQAYVSRAALKLVSALDTFSLDPENLACLDLGASTGGFTQVLLQHGATHVFAVDVGHGQLVPEIADHPRVTSLEKLNARDLTLAHLDNQAPQLVVSDMSFISLKLAAEPALNLASAGAQCVLLVKPQFEVGRPKIGKGGLVSNADAQNCVEDLRMWLDALPAWNSIGIAPSPITGGDGNSEFLLVGSKDG
ncbi:MAG: TlyA family RNA methyltransferase [Pseudomonadota bacterium]